ncbi:MAG TPA: DUF3604 domain-containing protein, partial [Longimicrobiaceae bacterium]|nr:DUF3604 domain-containing protein [Longimicrobiaceae bacterium]
QGTGDPGRVLRYAEDAAFLDWCALTPDDGTVCPDQLARLVDGADEDGRFVTLPALEWAGVGGRGVVLAREWGTLLHPFLPAGGDPRTCTPRRLHGELADRRERAGTPDADFLLVPHGAAAAEQADHASLSQVYARREDDCEGPLAGYVRALMQGAILGVAAGGDSHSARPGSHGYGALTAVLAAEHTRDGVFDALRARHTYATTGHRLLMELRADGAIMGDVVEDTLIPELIWRVASPQPITRVRLVRVRAGRAEDVVDESYPEGSRRREVTGTFRDEEFSAEAWDFASYFLVAHHEGEGRGWTSPIFFRRR